MADTIKIDQSSKKKTKALYMLLLGVAFCLIVYIGFDAFIGVETDKKDVTATTTDRIIVDGDTTQVTIEEKIKLYEKEEQRNTLEKRHIEEKESTLDEIFAKNDHVDTAVPMDVPLDPQTDPEVQKKQYNTSVSSNIAPKLNKNNTKAIIKKPKAEEKQGFYSSSEDNTNQKSEEVNDYAYKEFYKAYVDRDEILRAGQTLHLRFEESAYINGVSIPKSTMFTGVVSLAGERAMIKVVNIKLPDMILPTKIKVFDLEGNEGLYMPGGFQQEAANEAAQSGSNVNVNIPLIGSFSKSTAKKKIADRTCKFNKNYKVLIKDFSEE